MTTSVGDSTGNSTYNSAQLKAQKRLSKGLYTMVAYTFSKTISDGESDNSDGTPGVGSLSMAQNALNRRAEKGLSDLDVPQRFVTSYGWELPFGHGKRFLSQSRGLDKLVGGWQVSGILTLSSGNPYDITIASTTLNTGTAQRPNRIASGVLSNPSNSQYFDLAALTVTAPFTFGNAGRNFCAGRGCILSTSPQSRT